MSLTRLPRRASGLIIGLLVCTAHPAWAGDHPFQLDLDDEEGAFMFALFGTAGYGAIAQTDAKEEVFLLGGGAMLQLYTPDINILGNLWGVEYQFQEAVARINGTEGLPLMRHNVALRVMWGLKHLYGGLLVGWQFDEASRARPDVGGVEGESKRVPKLGMSLEIHTGLLYHRYSYMVDLNGSTSVFSGQFSWGVVF